MFSALDPDARPLRVALVNDYEILLHGLTQMLLPHRRSTTAPDWPGRTQGLTHREGEMVTVITQGRSNVIALPRDSSARCPGSPMNLHRDRRSS